MSKSHAAMMSLPNTERKNYFDYVKNDINSVKNMDDLKTLGDTMKSASNLDIKEAEDLLNLKHIQDKSVPKLAALCIVIPVQIAPKQLNILIEKFLPDLNNIPKNFQTGIAYKYAETALIIGEGQKLFEKGTLSSLFSDNPAVYAGPYLYLLVSIKNPIDIFVNNSIPYSKHARTDVQTLLHYGENLLFLRNFEKSEQILLRAYKLAKKTENFNNIMKVVEKLSLASFLNHTPYLVFHKYLKLTHQPQGLTLNIWDLDDSNYLSKIQDTKKFFDNFLEEILYEHTRRVIFDYADTTSEMNLQSLIDACNNPNTEAVLLSLRSSGEIKFKIQEGNIKFIRHNYQEQINCEQEKIDNYLKTFKK